MENPFEIIIEKLVAIEKRIASIEVKLNSETDIHTSKNVMSINQLCEYCGFAKSYVYKQTSTREIPHYKKGKRLYFKKTEIDDWLLKTKVKTMDEIQREATIYTIRRRK